LPIYWVVGHCVMPAPVACRCLQLGSLPLVAGPSRLPECWSMNLERPATGDDVSPVAVIVPTASEVAPSQMVLSRPRPLTCCTVWLLYVNSVTLKKLYCYTSILNDWLIDCLTENAYVQGGPNWNTPAVNLRYLGNHSEYYHDIYSADRELSDCHTYYYLIIQYYM